MAANQNAGTTDAERLITFKNQDLQVSKIASGNFIMAHRMSLAKITLKYKTGVVTTKNYTWNTSTNQSSVQNRDVSNVMASNNFNTSGSYVKPYYHTTESNQEINYFIAKYDEKPQLIDNDVTEYKKWTSTITIQNASQNALGKGCYSEFSAISRAEGRLWCYYVADFPYTGKYQQFNTPISGTYKIECWGASGGPKSDDVAHLMDSIYCRAGRGAYVAGNIIFSKNDSYYVYVGGKGYNNAYDADFVAYDYGLGLSPNGGWNGGGNSISGAACGGGGATDVRVKKSEETDGWSGVASLRSRFIVAGGGGGENTYAYSQTYANGSRATGSWGGHAGGLIAPQVLSRTPLREYANKEQGIVEENGNYIYVKLYGGTQTAGGQRALGNSDSGSKGEPGEFGKGGNGTYGCGGGGWYGGQGGDNRPNLGNDPAYANYTESGGEIAGGGGSSFISGHPGCNGINASGTHLGASQPSNITGKGSFAFLNGTTVMIDGAGREWTTANQTVGGNEKAMPSNPDMTNSFVNGGNEGYGYCRITFVSE